MSKDCRYCRIISEGSANRYDTLLEETKSFVVMPTIGSLVAGWQLIVPKRHVLNCAQLTKCEKLELSALINRRVEQTHLAFDGDAFIFEHGAIEDKSLFGCGVDHAHIHIVPLEFDLVTAFLSSVEKCKTIEKSITKFYEETECTGEPYWLVGCSNQSTSHILSSMKPQSQFFRRLIAERLGIYDVYDYKLHALEHMSDQTVYAFSQEKKVVNL